MNDALWNVEGRSVRAQTVDGFQGNERELVAVSTVRSTVRGGVGFLADFRRVNAALSRATLGAVVVGDARTLQRDPVWFRVIRTLEERGCVFSNSSLRRKSQLEGGGRADALGVVAC